ISASLSLMRRLPPNKIEQNLNGLLNLIPEETDELLQRVDQPLKEGTDAETGRKYLLCDYNRDGDSYRSPWSNKYDPSLDDGFLPSEKLRQMEVEFNELFDAYRELYYEGGTSSVYLWDQDQGFAGCFLIKKNVAGDRYVKNGCWDSIHVVEATETESTGSATYKLTTTVMLHMSVGKEELGDTVLAGSLTRQGSLTASVSESKTHIANIGRMIEDMEIEMRSNLNELYILKTREVVNSLRKLHAGPDQNMDHIASLNAAVLGHGKGRIIDSES
ncbi:F-actin-capping protein subunit beta, partial [Ochromonadaceae sp. CCMP2298]